MEARCSQAWDHTAALMTLFGKIHHDRRKGRSPTLSDFHPYLRSSRRSRAPSVDRDRWIAAALSANGKRGH